MERLSKGLWPVMLTPFKENHDIDLGALEQLTEFYLLTGASGLFANCLSSEMFQLTSEERILITATVVRKVNGRIPVVSTGTFGKDLKQNSEFIKKMYDSGVQAVVINSNQLTDASEPEDTFKAKIEELLETTKDIPLGIYECPVPYKRLLSIDLMNWLGKTGRFLYHKDTSCNLVEIKEKIKAVGNTPLGIYDANTPTALGSLQADAQGLSPIGSNFYPELYAYLISNMASNEKKVTRLNNLLTVLDSTTDNRYYPLSAKIFLGNRGMRILPVSRLSKPFPEPQDLIKLEAIMEIMTDQAEILGLSLVKKVNR